MSTHPNRLPLRPSLPQVLDAQLAVWEDDPSETCAALEASWRGLADASRKNFERLVSAQKGDPRCLFQVGCVRGGGAT